MFSEKVVETRLDVFSLPQFVFEYTMAHVTSCLLRILISQCTCYTHAHSIIRLATQTGELGVPFSCVAFALREVRAWFIVHYLNVNVQPSPIPRRVCFSTDCSIFGHQMYFSVWVSGGPDVHRSGIFPCPHHRVGQPLGFGVLDSWGRDGYVVDSFCGSRDWGRHSVDLGWASLSCVLLGFICACHGCLLSDCCRCQLAVMFNLAELEAWPKIKLIF